MLKPTANRETSYKLITLLLFEEYTGDGGALVKLERKAKPFSLWFEFRFDMVDGKPIVETVKR